MNDKMNIFSFESIHSPKFRSNMIDLLKLRGYKVQLDKDSSSDQIVTNATSEDLYWVLAAVKAMII